MDETIKSDQVYVVQPDGNPQWQDKIEVKSLALLSPPKFVVKAPLFLPTPKHPGDAGADIRAYIDSVISEEDAFKCYRQSRLMGYKVMVNGKPVDDYEPRRDAGGRNTVGPWSEPDANPLYDAIRAADPECRAVMLQNGSPIIINAGFKIALPESVYGDMTWCYEIVSRSGLAVKHGVKVTNGVGVIDAGYRDWVHVALECIDIMHIHFFTYGARVAQGLMVRVAKQDWFPCDVIVDSLDDTSRGLGGFGSTGVE